MKTAAGTKADAIRKLNDAFRKSLVGGVVTLTPSVASLSEEARAKIVASVRGFTDFHQGNDPHHEHDFAGFEVDGETYFFKIDYFDRAMHMHSPDPANPEVTTRVLTIMRADEY